MTNKFSFENLLNIVAYINNKEIGNIKMVYGNFREYFDVEENEVIGKNVMYFMPDIIASNLSGVMRGYPYEIKKYILGRHIDSFLCGNSRLIQPLKSIFKYLPSYSINSGVLLSAYWKEKDDSNQHHIFLNDDNLVKHYSKSLVPYVGINSLDYDIPVKELVPEYNNYLL